MAPPSVTCLSKYLLDLKYTCTAPDPSLCACGLIPWKGSTIVAVICYVRKQLSDSDYDKNMMTKEILWYLNDAAREYARITEDFKYPSNRRAIKEEISQIIVNSLIPEARKYFRVPKLQHLRDVDVILKPNEILASFMAFLVELLNCESRHAVYESYNHLYGELTFVLIALGDSLFEFTDVQEVDNVLTEFETLANEAGSYIHSFLFTTFLLNDSRSIQDGNALLRKLKLLNARIMDQMKK